ncbi:MAG: TadE family protein [Candidatus Korobacteraceae bacterium]
MKPNKEAGTALVEFALSTVLVLTLIFAVIDFGRAVFAYVWVAHTARVGARYAMVTGSDCVYPNGSSCQINNTQLTSYLQTSAQGIDWSDVTVQAGCISANAPSQLPCATGVEAVVQVQYQFGFICPFLPHGTWVMTSTSARTVL